MGCEDARLAAAPALTGILQPHWRDAPPALIVFNPIQDGLFFFFRFEYGYVLTCGHLRRKSASQSQA
jgi:hypothetical protein